jgi:hypothetical protein
LIGSVETDQDEILTADLFVDCTGFRSVLLGDALDVPLQSYAKYLLCDRAVTMRVPYEVYRPDRILTYTKATARESGWQWDINLQSRRGIGYVYSSQFLDADAAETALRQFEGPHSEALEAHTIHERQACAELERELRGRGAGGRISGTPRILRSVPDRICRSGDCQHVGGFCHRAACHGAVLQQDHD